MKVALLLAVFLFLADTPKSAAHTDTHAHTPYRVNALVPTQHTSVTSNHPLASANRSYPHTTLRQDWEESAHCHSAWAGVCSR